MKTIWEKILFGGNYLTAILTYLGLSLLLLGITPDSSSVHAQNGCGGEMTCPAGQVCCGGVCCSSCFDGQCCMEQ
ncbi:MAG: hypothetical protein LBJ00_11725 [Planctomycetaceae bacterium]|jgi:hypothetical protein|nr:hypothetical protein [Planctomycetaceae bacterium]